MGVLARLLEPEKGIKTAPSVLREDPLLLRTVRCRLALRRRESFEYLCLYAFDLSQAFDINFRSEIFFRSPERKVMVPDEYHSKQDQKRSYNKSGINKGFSHPALQDPIKK